MKRIGYVTFGSVVHGAEKRIIKLALDDLHVKNGLQPAMLIINKELFENASEDDALGPMLKKKSSQVLVVPDPGSKLWAIKKKLFSLRLLWYKFAYRIKIFHVYLGAISAATPVSILGVKVVAELTSPDMADRFFDYVKRYPFFVKRLYRVNCVSKSVYHRFNAKLEKKYEGLCQVVYLNTPYADVNLSMYDQDIEKEKILVCASRFIERKNVVRFAEMIKPLCQKGLSWRYEILGSGPLEGKLKKTLSDEIYKGFVRIHYSNDIGKILSKSSCIVSLIEPDNYPSQSIFEAMALGNAVVVSDTGESHRLVDGSNGIVLKDKEGSETLFQLLSNDEALREMQLNSREYFIEAFSKKVYFEELLSKCY